MFNWRKHLFLFLCLYLCDLSFCYKPYDNVTIERVIESWRKFDDQLVIDLNLLTSGFYSIYEEIFEKSNISKTCDQSLRDIFSNATHKEFWALKVLDSWGRFPPSGVLDGSRGSLGSYDECLSILEIPTHFCSVRFSFDLPKRPRFHNVQWKINELVKGLNSSSMLRYFANYAHLQFYGKYRIGLCLPLTCTTKDISKTTKTLGERLHLNGSVVNCNSDFPDVYQHFPNVYQLVSIALFALVICSALIGTAMDYQNLKVKTEFNLRSVFIAFSIRKNITQIFNTDKPNWHLSSLNGIRFWTLTWIIMAHTICWIHYEDLANSTDVVDKLKLFWMQWLYNGTLSVDTFFLISGILTSYVSYVAIDGEHRKFSTFAYIVIRYIRIVPGLIFAMAGTLLLPYFGSGIFFHEFIDYTVEACEKNWWVNLLFLQNFLDPLKICVLPSWWLAIDFQLHILSLISVILFLRKPLYGFLSAFVSMFVIASFGVYKYINSDFPPTALATHLTFDEYWPEYVKGMFYKVPIHAGPFYIGLILGFIIAKKYVFNLSKTMMKIIWTSMLLLLFVNLFSVYFWNNGVEYSHFVAVTYGNTARTIWALSVAWIVYAVYVGQGGVIGAFLNCKFFVPASRITFMTFLSHLWLILLYVANAREVHYISGYFVVYLFISHYVSALILGLFLTLLCESPFLALEKTIVRNILEHRNNKSQHGYIKDENENIPFTEENIPNNRIQTSI